MKGHVSSEQVAPDANKQTTAIFRSVAVDLNSRMISYLFEELLLLHTLRLKKECMRDLQGGPKNVAFCFCPYLRQLLINF